MSSEEMNKLLSSLSSLERELDSYEQKYDQRKRTLIQESKGPISKERGAQILIELGNLNYERRNQTDVLTRKIQDVKEKIRHMFDCQNKCK
jgi:hypothetical protein